MNKYLTTHPASKAKLFEKILEHFLWHTMQKYVQQTNLTFIKIFNFGKSKTEKSKEYIFQDSASMALGGSTDLHNNRTEHTKKTSLQTIRSFISSTYYNMNGSIFEMEKYYFK